MRMGLKRRKANLSRLLVLFLVLSSLGNWGCGPSAPDAESAPRLLEHNIQAASDGTEEGQTVTVGLVFDRPVTVARNAGNEFRIVIGGNRVKGSAYTVTASPDDERKILIRIAVMVITTGELLIEPQDAAGAIAAITGAGTKVPAVLEPIHSLIATGLELATVKAVPGTDGQGAAVTKEVTAIWKVRSIVWVQLMKDGQVMTPDAAAETKWGGALAVHGHDFLSASPESAARDIAEALQTGFGSQYEFTVHKNTFTVRSKTPVAGEQLDVRILESLPEE